jgi:hypothetical protein
MNTWLSLHRLVAVGAAGLVLTAATAGAQAVVNTARLSHTETVRGGLVTVEVDPAPFNTATARMTLERYGSIWDVDPVAFTPQPVGNKVTATVTGQVPIGVPLGDYVVAVYLTKAAEQGKAPEQGKPSEQRVFRPSEHLSVVPVGAAKPSLLEFAPDHTYEIATHYAPTKWQAVRSKLVRLKLAQLLSRNDRHRLRVERGSDQFVIAWKDECPKLSAPGAGNPIPLAAVIGRVTPDDDQPREVELCAVPEDAEILLGREQLKPQRVGDPFEVDLRGTPMPGAAVEPYRIMGPVVLHGAGFQLAPEDNVVWINGQKQVVDWNGCNNDAAVQTAPRALVLTGEVKSAEEIRLCGIIVPVDGQVRVAVGYGDTASATRVYRAFAMKQRSVIAASAAIAFVLALIPLALLSTLRKSYPINGQSYKFRLLFLDPETDTYSLSKLQFYMWTLTAIFSYAYLFISRVQVQNAIWPDVPGTLPGVIAVAGGTAVGSQLITSIKGSKGSGEQKPSWADFITSGGVVAADRLQMFTWTLFGVAAFIAAVARQEPGTITELPALPERLLMLMGLSSSGYLAGKMARKAGPVINEISVTPAESNEGLAKAATSSAATLPDLTKPLSDAQARLAALKPVTNANAKAAVDALTNAIKAASAAHTTAEFNALIASLTTSRATAEAAATKAATDFAAKTATGDEAQAAQNAAAALQDLSSDVTQAISLAASVPMNKATGSILVTRTIEIRGTNLSPEGLFEIDHVDLPFRMLKTTSGPNAPEVVVRDDTSPTFARVLRLTIDPSALGSSDLEQFNKWFGSDGRRTLSITNLDGQKAELAFDLPPRPAQPSGATK